MIPGAPQEKPMPSQSPNMNRSVEAQEAVNFISQSQGRMLSDQEIEWLVGMRERVRQNKDFSSSDELRNLMRNALGIELLEKEKRWQASDGRQGVIPLWTSLA
mmetsp:Transcript_35658/g.76037  ORF Transcript_35658/g.76037 Transcript_35658/m.76037 type:complete len:103 (-) Transcript_35658:124-432(-)